MISPLILCIYCEMCGVDYPLLFSHSKDKLCYIRYKVNSYGVVSVGKRAAQNCCGIEAERKVVMTPTRAKVAFITQWSLWLGPGISMKPSHQTVYISGSL